MKKGKFLWSEEDYASFFITAPVQPLNIYNMSFSILMFCDGDDCSAEIDLVSIIVSQGPSLNFYFGEQEYARNWYKRSLIVKSDRSSSINVQKLLLLYFFLFIYYLSFFLLIQKIAKSNLRT